MTVLEYLRGATLHGVAVALADHIGLAPDEIDGQLRKAIDILGMPILDRDPMYVELEYIVPMSEDPSWGDPYWAVHGVYYQGLDPDGIDKQQWCIAITPWGEWLSMSVYINGPAISDDEVAALLLYEMTSAGDPRRKTQESPLVDRYLGDMFAYAWTIQNVSENDTTTSFCIQEIYKLTDLFLSLPTESLTEDDFQAVSDILRAAGTSASEFLDSEWNSSSKR